MNKNAIFLVFRKIFVCLVMVSFCFGGYAETITLDWQNEDGTTRQTTTCEIGGNIVLPTPPTKYGYTFAGWTNFIPIEYLQNTSTQWIDTGYKLMTSHVKMHIKFERLSSGWGVIMGSNNTQGNANHLSLWNNAWDDDCYWFIHTGMSVDPHIQPCINKVIDTYVEVFTDGTFVINTDGVQTTGTYTENFLTSARGNVLLYTTSYNPTSSTYMSENTKIFFVKIYDDGVLVRDIIPVLDLNNVPCMYDKVTRQFLYNAGTGDFIAGPIISE